MEFRLLGPLEAVDDDGGPVALGSGKRCALLVDLLLNLNRTVPVSRLIDDLWGEAPPDTAVKAVQIHVSQLRKALPEPILKTRSPGYAIELPPEGVDLYRFEGLVAAGREALVEGIPGRAAELLAEALSLWRGAALAEFEEPFAQVEAARIQELRLAAVEERIEADLASGRHAELTGELETLLRRHPLRERLHGQQMLALYRAGRQAEALACYQGFRRLLDEQLGIEPSARLRELERGILRQDPGLELAASGLLRSRPAPGTAPRPREGASRPAAAPATVVGRDAELGRLRRLLDEALTGQRQVAFVSGQPGIGKSTLVEAFLTGTAGAHELLVARGRCFEQYGAGEAFMPLLEALGRLCEGSQGDEVVQLLATHAPTWLAQLPAHTARADPPAAPAGVATTSERMLRELVEAVEAIAALRPLVVLLEDLHWSDVSTVDVVNALARREEVARLLLLGTYRPGDARAAEHPILRVAQELGLRALATETRVTPLPPRAVVDYLDSRFPANSLPLELSSLLHERTDGNPLFLQKVVDGWLEAGSIAAAEGTWGLRASLAELAIDVPATLRQLVEHRLDDLDRGDQELLETASAAGAEFATAAVAAGSGRDPDEVEARCAELASQERFLRALGEQAWPDATVSTTYGFVHDLFQEIAYGRLPPGRRARVHRAIGARLESGYGDEVAEIAPELAVHFVRGRDPRRAVSYLRLAAALALQRAGHREAIEQLTAAIEMLDALPATRERDEQEIALRIELGETLMEARGYAAPEVRESFAQARALCARVGRTPHLLQVLNGLSTIAEVSGAYRAALELAEEFLRLAQGGPEDALADARAALGWPLVCLGRFEAALDRLEPLAGTSGAERLRPLRGIRGSSFPEVEARAIRAWALWLLGYPDRALSQSADAISLAEDLGHPFSAVYAITCDAFLRQLRKERSAAAEQAAAGKRLAAEHGFPLWDAWGSIVHGWAAELHPDAALAEVKGGVEAAAATGSRWAGTYLLALLADVYARCGHDDAGLLTLDEALALAAANEERFYVPELRRLQAEIQLKLGREQSAESSLLAALELAQGLGARIFELRAAVGLGRLWCARGRDGEAGELVAGRYAWFSEGFDTPDLIEAKGLLGELGISVPGPGSARGQAGAGDRDPPGGQGSLELDGPRRLVAAGGLRVHGGPLTAATRAAPRAVRAPGPRPAVRYARSGELSIAYQVTGGGTVDLVLVPGFVSHLEKDWEEPRHARFLDRLGSFSRLIRFDKRGTGLSDRPGNVPDLEARMDDVRAVMDAAGSGRAVLFGYSEGGPMSMLFAATYPERVAALVLYGVFAKRLDPDDDYPWAPAREAREAYIAQLASEWGYESDMRVMCPSADEEMARWWGERCRAAASPGSVRALMEMNSRIDVRSALGTIHTPTLVIHRSGDVDVRIEEGRYIAERIPGARFVELPGVDHFVAVDPDQILDAVEPFVTESPTGRAAAIRSRVLATIVVADVVDPSAARPGDGGRAELTSSWREAVRDELRRFAGEEIRTGDDGCLALFDGPSRAIRCGTALAHRLEKRHLSVRIGVHTGEVERTGADVGGVAVEVAAGVAAAAGPGDLLVTASTRDIVAGAKLEFEDRGEHVLEGFDEPRRLFAATAAG